MGGRWGGGNQRGGAAGWDPGLVAGVGRALLRGGQGVRPEGDAALRGSLLPGAADRALVLRRLHLARGQYLGALAAVVGRVVPLDGRPDDPSSTGDRPA